MKGFISGWGNVIKGLTTDIHKNRAKSCDKCPLKKESIIKQFLPDFSGTEEVNGMVCEPCGCPLQAKIRSEEKLCEKWEQ